MRDAIASRYELREKLGSSSTSTVWRARDRRRRRDVALKVANDQPADVLSRRQLASEAEAAGRLDHPNIVPLLDAHIGRSEAALAFTYVRGETLAKRLARGGALPAAEAAAIAADIAAALAHAHERGVVHRDVKPGNVILDTDGRVALFDFGIAATPDRSDSGLAPAGMTTGTLPYMAPEQLAGQPADPQSDVYALGVVLFEMLAGQRPYTAATTDGMAAQQQLPAAPIADAPPALASLAYAALDPDPRIRPRAATLERRLRAWLAGTSEEETTLVPAAAPQTSVVQVAPARVGPPLRVSRPSGVLLAGAGLVLIGVLAAGVVLASAIVPLAGPTPAPSFVPSSLPPMSTPTPTQEAGGGTSGGGGGGGGNSGNHGGKGHGHGKGH